MSNKGSRIKVLIGLSFILISFTIFSIVYQVKLDQEEPDYYIDGVNSPKKSGYWDENDISFIHIDNNWTNAFNDLDWVQGGDGSWGSPYLIENVTINAGGSGSGILIEDSNDYFIIRNCTVYNSGSGYETYDAGIKLQSVNNGMLINNSLSNNNGYLERGIYLENSDNNSVSGNNVTDNYYGIYLENSNNNTVSGNNASNNTDGGIKLYYSDNNTVSGNNAYNNSECGIWLTSSTYNIVSGNNVTNSENHPPHYYPSGIWLINSSYSTASGNIVYGMDNGIWLFSSSYSTVSGNTLHDNDFGIWVYGSTYSTVSGNNVTNHIYGIRLLKSDNNTVSGNIVYNNSDYGIYLEDSDNNTISENNATTNDYYGIWLSNSTYSTVSGNNVTDNYYGIYLENSNNNTVSENNAYNNTFNGIGLSTSDNNAVSGNNVTDNYYGIYLENSNNNTISENNATNNDWVGIHLDISNNNNVSENSLFFNVWSIIEEVSCEGNDIENNDRCTRIESAGTYDFEIIPYGTSDFDVETSITLDDDTKILLESLSINITNTTLNDGLIFVEITLNKSNNLIGKINITIKYTGLNELENLKGWWFNESVNNGKGAWQEVTISIKGNLTIFTENHTSIYALTGSEAIEEESTNGGDSPAQEPPGDFTLTHNTTDSDTDGTFMLNWNESNGADNYSIYVYESYITEINVSVPAVAHGITALNYTITGLNNGTYFYVVVAFNEAGNTLSNCVEITVQIPPEEGDGDDIIPQPIPFGGYFLFFTTLGIIILVLSVRKKVRNNS